MANMTVRNLPDEVHERLRAQAQSNGRSLEAEVRSILVYTLSLHPATAVSDTSFASATGATSGMSWRSSETRPRTS